jgi:hypothetical protein
MTTLPQNRDTQRRIVSWDDWEVFLEVDRRERSVTAYEVEWDDEAGLRHYVTWTRTGGYRIGAVDPEALVLEPGPERTFPSPDDLRMIFQIARRAGLEPSLFQAAVGRPRDAAPPLR